VELVLCRDIYHCTPQELDKVDVRRLAAHLAMYAIEKKVEAQRGNKRKPGRGKSGFGRG